MESVTSQIQGVIAPTAHARRSAGLDLGAVLADGAPEVTVAVADQGDLLATLETRLADEVLDIATALLKFGSATQAIGKELPLTSHFGKLVTVLLSSFSLQFAYALLKGKDKPLLLDDGDQHLAELGLQVEQFVREVSLDGRRFLAVALLDEQAAQLGNSIGGG